MKIVYISNSIIPSRTANSIHVMKMCQAFADNGHQVVLLAPNRKKEYEKGVEDIYEFYGVKKSFEVRKLPFPNIKGKSIIYTFFVFLYLFINKRNIDLVYGRNLNGCYISTKLAFQTIFESHAPEYNTKSYKKIFFESITKNKNLQKMIVISQALKNMYLENGYLSDDKIQVAHDGADEVLDFDSKVELLGNKDSLKVGYVGHLYKGKGIEVVASISDKISQDIEFHIVGGLEKDIQDWKEKINSKNVFFYGFVSQNAVRKYINSFDICILPNQKVVLTHGAKDDSSNISDFTSPLKMFEYMAHKKAIISSDLPVLREVLNETNSILVNPENSIEWIEAIKKLKDETLREKLSNKALSDFQKYTWKNRANSIIR